MHLVYEIKDILLNLIKGSSNEALLDAHTLYTRTYRKLLLLLLINVYMTFCLAN